MQVMTRGKKSLSWTIAANLEIIFSNDFPNYTSLHRLPSALSLLVCLSYVLLCCRESTRVCPSKATGFLNEPHLSWWKTSAVVYRGSYSPGSSQGDEMLSVSQLYRSQWVLLLISSKSSLTVRSVLIGAQLFKQVLGGGGQQHNLVLC